MKNFGFTLSEVLITLGIVGVIAALSMPSLIANTQNKTNAASLASAVTDIENAIANMMLIEDVIDLSEINFNNFTKYIRLTNTEVDPCDNFYDCSSNKPIKQIGNNSGAFTTTELRGYFSLFYLTNSGALLAVAPPIDPCEFNDVCLSSNFKIYIDVNGKKKPNTAGRDFFAFFLGSDGKLYPYGGKEATRLLSSAEYWEDSQNIEYACNDKIKSLGCTGRLIENNFTVDY
jgi:prepilin-type N-terminal cleavage/methylation domain-containing protein